MHRVRLSADSCRPADRWRVFWAFLGLVPALTAPGCHRQAEPHSPSVAKPQTVRLIQPQVRTIVRVVGQPSFTQSYERSSVYPKMNAYILKWIVDIGDKVKKGDVLATLFVPELVEDHRTKKATVVLEQERIALAKEVVEVAKAEVEAALARLEEAQAEFAGFRAEAERWDSETKRLEGELKRGVVNPQDVLQTTNRWKASVSSRDSAAATIQKADAELLSRRAALSKAKVGVAVALANLKVAESEEKRLQAWVDYLVLPAPYDGVIVARNANTFDFVLPTKGDPSALSRSLPVTLESCRADLCGRPHRHRPHLRRHPRAVCRLRPHRLQGHRACERVSRPADRGLRHAHLLGAQRQEPHAPCRG